MAVAANRGRSWETLAPRRTRASSRHLPSHTAPQMSFELNLAAPEPRLLTWRLKNVGPASSRPRWVLFQWGRDSSGRNSDGCVGPRWPFPAAKHFSPGKASGGRRVGMPSTQCELGGGRCRWAPGLEPSGPCGAGTPAPTGKQDCKPHPLLSLILLWTPCALPGPAQGSQSKTFWPFCSDFRVTVSPSEGPRAP